ncbi:MAG: hypothetical protein PVF28_01760 [Thioalkalispiraceae bacterium]|jgi:hypothetical protein
MNKVSYYKLLLALSVSLLLSPVNAERATNDLSYSHEHWPSRWSSAIRQQQGNKYPTRKREQNTPPELPEAVSENDLFHSPSQRKRYGRTNRSSRFDRHLPRKRFYRQTSVNPRAAAVAYQPVFNGRPYTAFASQGLAHGYPVHTPAIDPVLGHPGIGIPIMPGIPLGYPVGVHPYAGVPYGYPGSMGMWNPPFGLW